MDPGTIPPLQRIHENIMNQHAEMQVIPAGQTREVGPYDHGEEPTLDAKLGADCYVTPLTRGK